MPSYDHKQKLVGLAEDEGEKQIVVTHVTIRQSIFFLHLRLVALEVLAGGGLVVMLAAIFSGQLPDSIESALIAFNVPLLIFLISFKLGIMIFIIVSWLNQYYEISPTNVVFRKGLITKQEERNLLKHIGEITIEQGLFGRIFNFGTLRLFNWTNEKNVYLYLIHNPHKYRKILESLIPEADMGRKIFREHILEPEEEEKV